MENKNEEVSKTGEAIKKIVESISKKDKTDGKFLIKKL